MPRRSNGGNQRGSLLRPTRPAPLIRGSVLPSCRASRIYRHMSALPSAADVTTSTKCSSAFDLSASPIWPTNPARPRAKRRPAKPRADALEVCRADQRRRWRRLSAHRRSRFGWTIREADGAMLLVWLFLSILETCPYIVIHRPILTCAAMTCQSPTLRAVPSGIVPRPLMRATSCRTHQRQISDQGV